MGPVKLIAFQRAKPERRDELAAVIRSLRDASSTETGCLAYSVSTEDQRPDVFVLQEVWESKADLDRHFESAAFQEFWTRRMDYLQSDVEIHFISDLV